MHYKKLLEKTEIFLTGKKTYFAVLAGALTILARMLGYIDETTFELLLSLFGLGSVAALRSAVK